MFKGQTFQEVAGVFSETGCPPAKGNTPMQKAAKETTPMMHANRRGTAYYTHVNTLPNVRCNR